jgi:hypothetical protein
VLSVATKKLASLIQVELTDLLAKGNWMGRAVAKSPIKTALVPDLAKAP